MITASPNFWRGKQVFLTGHTGFKGAWMALWLSKMGAKVTGISLPPNSTPNLFTLANIAQMTDENSVGVSRVASTAGQLKSMADELKQAVSGFRV